MKRLPIKFEEEVLSKRGEGIVWDNDREEYIKEVAYIDECCYGKTDVSSYYEIVGIALKEILNVKYSMRMYKDKYAIAMGYDVITEDNSDIDFCECVFKAIRKIYGE